MTALHTPVGPAPSRFHILALDGGGVKGLFSAAVLAAIEQDLGQPVLPMFDLVVGTSTGGIIALALGAALSPADVVKLYRDLGSLPFHGWRWRRRLSWLRSAYPPGRLRDALEGTLGDRTMRDSVHRLVIPAYDLTNDGVRLFKTPHHPDLKRDGGLRMVDVAMATAAAPTYYPATTVDSVRLVDGGVWVNNPLLVGVTEAVSMFGAPLDAIRVLSIGSTTDLKHRRSSLDNGGKLRWAGEGLDLILRAQSLGATNTALHLLGPQHVLRLDPDVPAGRLRLDRADAHELAGRAADVSRKNTQRFSELFADHLAPAFVPHPHHNEDRHDA